MVDDLGSVGKDSGPQIRRRFQGVRIGCAVGGNDLGTKWQRNECGMRETTQSVLECTCRRNGQRMHISGTEVKDHQVSLPDGTAVASGGG